MKSYSTICQEKFRPSVKKEKRRKWMPESDILFHRRLLSLHYLWQRSVHGRDSIARNNRSAIFCNSYDDVVRSVSKLKSSASPSFDINSHQALSDHHETLLSPHSAKFGSDTGLSMETMQSEPTYNDAKMTLKGATYKLLRFHLHDWLAIFGLAILYGVLNAITPFYRFVGQTMIGDYMFPLKPNTIPFQAVPVIVFVFPLIVFVVYFLYTKDITDLHHAILGLFFAVLITAVITGAIKDAVGRPRPDFFWRCFPDGNAVYRNDTGEVVCHGEKAVIKEGYKSFPSGHASGSFAGMTFLSMYLAGKVQLFNGRGHVAKLCIVFAPLLLALLVGLSRVDDYWHHWEDVFAGALIGMIMAVLSYHHMFPSIFGENSAEPDKHLQIGKDFNLACFRRLKQTEHENDV